VRAASPIDETNLIETSDGVVLGNEIDGSVWNVTDGAEPTEDQLAEILEYQRKKHGIVDGTQT
jgi:hypothetical protein